VGGLSSETTSRIEVLDYPASAKPFPAPWVDLVEIGTGSFDGSENKKTEYGSLDAASAENAANGVERDKSNFEAGREQGIREGREAEALRQCALLQEAEKQGAHQAAELANQFAVERDRFLETVEREVVKLALAIAARILRHEAQTDPLFLVGAVRVALGQLAATLQVRVRVPASDASLWSETLAHIPNLKVRPAVVADESMTEGNCAIETEMGSVDLGLASQLRQIESDLFDQTLAKERTIHIGAGQLEMQL
jgi:flagellar assembly protein FliH